MPVGTACQCPGREDSLIDYKLVFNSIESKKCYKISWTVFVGRKKKRRNLSINGIILGFWEK